MECHCAVSLFVVVCNLLIGHTLREIKSGGRAFEIQEFTVNGDAYATGSTYFYKPRGDKMYFGPLWDFDLAWSEIGDEEEYVGVEGFNHTFMPWIDDLRAKDPMFVEIIKEEWAKLDPALTELTKSGGIIDQYREEVRAAYAADPIFAEIEDADIDKQTEGLSRWTDARHEWFAENEDKFGAVYATVTYVADGEADVGVREVGELAQGRVPDLVGHVLVVGVGEMDELRPLREGAGEEGVVALGEAGGEGPEGLESGALRLGLEELEEGLLADVVGGAGGGGDGQDRVLDRRGG